MPLFLLLVLAPLSAEQPLDGGILTLRQDFGRAVYAQCHFTVFYNQPHRENGTDRVELRCTPNVSPRVNDVAVTRRLTSNDVDAVARLAIASDLYSGGHTGRLSSTDGPWERLEVGHCCGRDDQVVLITSGDPTFSTGPRAELLHLLDEWRTPLFKELLKRKWR